MQLEELLELRAQEQQPVQVIAGLQQQGQPVVQVVLPEPGELRMLVDLLQIMLRRELF